MDPQETKPDSGQPTTAEPSAETPKPPEKKKDAPSDAAPSAETPTKDEDPDGFHTPEGEKSESPLQAAKPAESSEALKEPVNDSATVNGKVTKAETNGDEAEAGGDNGECNTEDQEDQSAEREEGEEGGEGEEEEGEDDEAEDEEEKLDDDEIEESPAFIPKSGPYYMHDIRGALPKSTSNEEDEKKPEKKSRADGAKWTHDRFDEKWQQPKSKKQLINKYGFDIREGTLDESGQPIPPEKLAAEEKKPSKPTAAKKPPPRTNNNTTEERPGQRRSGFRPKSDDRQYDRNDRRPGRGGGNQGGPGRRDEDFPPLKRSDGPRGPPPRRDDGGYQGDRTDRRGDRAYGRGSRGGGAGSRQFSSRVITPSHNRDSNNTGRSNNASRGGENRRPQDGGHGHSENTQQTGPKRYSTQRGNESGHQASPPAAHSNTPPAYHPSEYRNAPSSPLTPPGGRLRQPTDVVYFDPTQQQAKPRNPIPPREKKIIPIEPPTS